MISQRHCVLLTVAAIVGCYPKAGPAPEPLSPAAVNTASTRWPGVTAASLAAGRDLFLARCNGCHGYPEASSIADERWPHIMDKMGPKAGLTPERTANVLHFLLASRTESSR
jgi:cytochrome c5